MLQDMKFSQWYCWILKNSEMLHGVAGWVLSDVWKSQSAFIFMIQQLKMKTLKDFEMLKNPHPTAQYYIPEDLNLWHYVCGTSYRWDFSREMLTNISAFIQFQK